MKSRGDTGNIQRAEAQYALLMQVDSKLNQIMSQLGISSAGGGGGGGMPGGMGGAMGMGGGTTQ